MANKVTKTRKVSTRGKLDSADKAKLRAMLRARREQLMKAVTKLENDTLKTSRKEASGDLSSVPYHMADLASDNYDQEFALGLIENEDEELREISEALKRLQKGSFGICPVCMKPIPKTRLMAIPYARLCVECKRKQEQQKETGSPG